MRNDSVYDVVIIGAGIVGLAVGYNLLLKKPGISLMIIEKESIESFHQSGNNSGVIHSGIYYKPGSEKAINCRLGYHRMLDFCKEYDIEHEICGKVIVATNKAEEEALMTIYHRGNENGLENLRILNRAELKEIEPHVQGTKAVFVPQAGIVDYKQVAGKLRELCEGKGAHFRFNSKVEKISTLLENHHISVGDETITGKRLVNCAGLYSDAIAEMSGLTLDTRIIPFRGEYYLLKTSKSYLVKNLVYPVPDPAFPFLGVHFTRRIGGERDAGPNAVLALRKEGYNKWDFQLQEFLSSITYPGFIKIAIKYWKVGMYEVYRSFSKKAFTKALQKLIPEIKQSDLQKGPAGVRAQLCSIDGKLMDDFVIKRTDNAIHVLNAPSPAATSSLQIGHTISDQIITML